MAADDKDSDNDYDDDNDDIDDGDDNDSDNDDEQTHGIVSFRRKLASLFVVASWALFYSIAPDASHWEELSSLALCLQVGALATVPVIVGKNSLPDIFFLAFVFIAGVFTLYEVITPKSFIKLGVHADLLSSQLAPSRNAFALAVSILSQLYLTASVHAAVTSPDAFSRPVPCTSGPPIQSTVFIVPKGLVGTHLRVD